MAGLHVRWNTERLDEDVEPFEQCLLELEGVVECDGKAAGLVDAHYVFANDLDPEFAFLNIWDLAEATSRVYDEVLHSDREGFRMPLPRLLEEAPGILVVHFIALRPEFRGMGLGKKVMREVACKWTDPLIGAVLLDVRPLQHRPRGYDDFDDEVRDLPWNRPEEDTVRLIRHFSGWGMEHLPGTSFMASAPEVFTRAVD